MYLYISPLRYEAWEGSGRLGKKPKIWKEYHFRYSESIHLWGRHLWGRGTEPKSNCEQFSDQNSGGGSRCPRGDFGMVPLGFLQKEAKTTIQPTTVFPKKHGGVTRFSFPRGSAHRLFSQPLLSSPIPCRPSLLELCWKAGSIMGAVLLSCTHAYSHKNKRRR